MSQSESHVESYSARRLESYAVMLWDRLRVSAGHGPACEYEACHDVCTALHGARMVLPELAAEAASCLYDLVWIRMMELGRQLGSPEVSV